MGDLFPRAGERIKRDRKKPSTAHEPFRTGCFCFTLKELGGQTDRSMIDRPRGMKKRVRLSRVHHPVKGSTKYNCLWWSLSNAFCASSASCLVFRMHTRNFSPLSSCRQRAHRLECSSRNRSRSGRLSEPDTVPRLSCSACLLEPGKSGPSILPCFTYCLHDRRNGPFWVCITFRSPLLR